MANRKSRKSTRRPSVARPATSSAALQHEAGEATAAPAPATIPPAPAPGRRRIERLATPVTSGGARLSRRSEFAPLESGDAAVPFDRVPYVPADLRRVALMAALMVVLIIVAAVIVSHTIG